MSKLYQHGIKRILDVAIAFIGVFLLLPLMLMIVLLLFITGHRTIFFTQKRVGLNEVVFSIYKFCTMTDSRDHNGALLPDEKRLTRFGKLLRKTSLDEIPQLFNVLKGDMSLIGPRPLLIQYLPLYNEEQKKRHLVKPGITGWAQVNGRNAISWQEKFQLDIWYVNHIAFYLDCKILLLTIKKVLASSDVNQRGEATIQPFRGND